MPKYKIGISRRPTSTSFSTNVTARTPQEAMVKAQQSYRNDVVLNAEPTAFKVNIARKPSRAERYIEIDAYSPQEAATRAERNHHGFVTVEILEIRNR